jgi:hypothetical protein
MYAAYMEKKANASNEPAICVNTGDFLTAAEVDYFNIKIIESLYCLGIYYCFQELFDNWG